MPGTTKNKVEFGINKLYVGLYNVSDAGVVSLGSPKRVPGAISFSAEEQGEKTTTYADNSAYWTGYSGGEVEGDVEVALFEDDFKETFLGYKRTTGGGLALIKNANKPSVYMMFEVEGDKQKRRIILYNGSLGVISREYNTIEDKKEPTTEKIDTTFIGDSETGITMASYVPEDAGYDTHFSNPPVPALQSDES